MRRGQAGVSLPQRDWLPGNHRRLAAEEEEGNKLCVQRQIAAADKGSQVRLTCCLCDLKLVHTEQKRM